MKQTSWGGLFLLPYSRSLCAVQKKSPESDTSYRLYATKWPVEVDLEEAVQDLSYHRCLVGQALELHGFSEGRLIKSDKAEIDELVRVLVSCEEQAYDIQGQLEVRDGGSHAVRSMAVLDPLEEDKVPIVPRDTIFLGEWTPEVIGSSEGLKIASVEVVEENPDVPLQTRTIPLEEVTANIEKWKPSIRAEYASLVSNTEAVEPLSVEAFQELCKSHVVELIPGKSVYTIKAYTGRLKTRGVGCGNDQHGLDTFSGGVDAHSLRLLLRNAAPTVESRNS